ncbi:MAG: hypothetical protein LBG59_03660 [Candidatus Peribacteria bacterium]|jgi:hypothetical protein|nr:hypothetical protein [Candidatus Peribacteria bacterium]
MDTSASNSLQQNTASQTNAQPPLPPSQPVSPQQTPTQSVGVQSSPAMQIQQLLLQQQQLQQQYNQIVAFLKANPTQTSEKTQEIKAQLDQLNVAYLQGQEQLKALGYTSIQVNKPVAIKEGAKSNFSFKKFAIGCSVLLLILVGLFTVILISLTKDANALAGVGITATTAKSLLTIFAGLIVGVIGLVGLGFLLTNIYRLITVKNQSKVRYVLGLLGAFVILGIAGGIAGIVFGQIGKIVIPDTTPVSTSIIDPYLVGKRDSEGTEAVLHIRDAKLIAPAEMLFTLNMPVWATYVATLGEAEVKSLTLNCGNPQNQTLSYQNTGFVGKCFYEKKGDYPVSITVKYDNLITKEVGLTTERPVGTLSFNSDIQLFLGTTLLSAQQGEINLGKAPAKISIDTTSIFRDFNLPNYNVLRDMDGDDVYDREQMVRFDYTYKLPKVYYPSVKFPDISDFIYTFPLRVEQSDVPICEVLLLNFEKTKYKIQTNFLDGSVSSIANYSYTITDVATKAPLTTLRQNSREVDYTFPEKGTYIVGVDFITVDGKRGSCESEPLELAKETLSVNYTINQKASGATSFTVLPQSAFSGEVIILEKVPQTLQINITSVSPDSPSLQKNVFVEGKVILNQGTLYEFPITEERSYTVQIIVTDTERELRKEIPLTFVVKRPDIIGKLIITPDTGYEPLNVVLDATQTTLTIP